jgi:alpha-tubulin suppressor-like RCC1 family protein
MPKDDINYKFTENGIVYDFYDVFVPAENFRQPALWVWGRNTEAQLGTNDATTRSTPVTTFAGGNNWKSVAGGGNFAAAIKTDGTLWTWGASNVNAPVTGTNDTTAKSTPVTTFVGGTNWKSVSCGLNHSAAIKTDGTLWTWGDNNPEGLGINQSTSDRSFPVTTFAGGTDWKSVACGTAFTVAIKTNGTLWTWGSGSDGRLGVNDTTQRNTPVTTFAGGTTWKSVACGWDHVVAIKTDGSLWIWGSNDNGRLGTNDTTQRLTPVTTFAGGTNWKSVGAGREHTLAIKTDGSLWLWGKNGDGELGDNTATNRNTPVTTLSGGNNWKQVDGGERHSAAVKTDGTLWTWGKNAITSPGALGINDTFNKFNPVTTFAGGTDWKSVACAYGHTVAIKYSPDP